MRMSSLISAGAVLVASSFAHAALFSSWENQLDSGWEHEGQNALPASSYNPGGDGYSTTIGVTHGSYSLRAKTNQDYILLLKNFSGGLRNAFLDAGNATDPVNFLVDVTIPAGSISPSDSGFIELLIPRAYGNPGVYDDIARVSLAGFTPDVPQTAVVTIPAGFASVGPDYFGIFLNVFTIRPKGSGDVYFDNLRIEPIPEPATISALTCVAAMMLRRRSR